MSTQIPQGDPWRESVATEQVVPADAPGRRHRQAIRARDREAARAAMHEHVQLAQLAQAADDRDS